MTWSFTSTLLPQSSLGTLGHTSYVYTLSPSPWPLAPLITVVLEPLLGRLPKSLLEPLPEPLPDIMPGKKRSERLNGFG